MHPWLTSPLLTRDMLSEIDRTCAEEYGLPLAALMENAGRAVAEAALAMVAGAGDGAGAGARAVVLCGPGHNGGDGLVAARHLANAGVRVAIAMVSDPPSALCATHRRVVEQMELPVHTGGAEACAAALAAVGGPQEVLVVDALFGTGLRRALGGEALAMVRWANGSAARVLAVDVPSGLDADVGEPLGEAIRAEATVSLVGLKRGFANPAASAFTGRVVVGDIGAPTDLIRRIVERASAEPFGYAQAGGDAAQRD